MTTKLEQAARQALEYMEGTKTVFTEDEELDEAISALREALDQFRDATKMVQPTVKDSLTVQEPVAWMHGIDCDPDDRDSFMVYYKQTPGYCIPLYAAPVRTKDLTDDQIYALDNKAEIEPISFARAVLKFAKELNHG